MKLFRKKTEPAIEAAATPQIKRSDTPLFGMLGGYMPLQTGEKQL